jgi:hypothetical protein
MFTFKSIKTFHISEEFLMNGPRRREAARAGGAAGSVAASIAGAMFDVIGAVFRIPFTQLFQGIKYCVSCLFGAIVGCCRAYCVASVPQVIPNLGARHAEGRAAPTDSNASPALSANVFSPSFNATAASPSPALDASTMMSPALALSSNFISPALGAISSPAPGLSPSIDARNESPALGVMSPSPQLQFSDVKHNPSMLFSAKHQEKRDFRLDGKSLAGEYRKDFRLDGVSLKR